MNHRQTPLAPIALLLAALATPAMSASSTSSAASDSASSTASSGSDSLKKSSDSSSKTTTAAAGDYEVMAVTAAAERPGTLRMTLQAVTDRSAQGEYFLYLPQQTVDRSELAAGQIVTARARPYVSQTDITLSAAPLDQYSFPSGHTLHATAFTLVAVTYYPALF